MAEVLKDQAAQAKSVNRLAVSLLLTLAGKEFTVPAGNIKRISLILEPYGYRGALDFWFVCVKEASEDQVMAEFVKQDLAKVKLTVDRGFDTVGESADPLVLQGLVEERKVSERVFAGLTGEPIMQRHYRITFADRAQVLWRQHFPTQLYVDSTLAQLVDANKPDGVKLTHAWQASKKTYPVLSLPLGVTPNGPASFYDYIHWLLHKHQAGLLYDYTADAYTIADKKAEFGSPVEALADDVLEWENELPPVSRATVSVLNGSTLAGTANKAVANKQQVTGVKREYLLRSSVESDLTDRVKLETKRHMQDQPRARMVFGRYPSTTMRPNLLLKFGEWSKNLFHFGQQYRVCRMEIDADAVSQRPTDDVEDDSNAYVVRYEAWLEKKGEGHFAQAAFCTPRWDLVVEGTVVSEVGDKPQETYQSYKDDKTSIDYYKVEIPLWKKQRVIVAYEPLFAPGQFYFPLYKGERVLVALEHDRARVSGFVDWRPGARLPLETQGNHLLLGKKSEDQTSISHIYKDAKPQLNIERAHGKDKQTFEVSEGRIFLRTVATKD